jgi:L-iditol 2-dehydrogenase
LREIGSTINGGFASHILIPKKLIAIGGLLPVPENVSNEEASLIEPLACCINGLNQVKEFAFQSAIILGDGPIGLMQSMLLKRLFPETKVIICGKVRHRLDTAIKLGADMTYLIKEEKKEGDIIKDLKEYSGKQSPNLVIISNNNPSSIYTALKIVNKNGKVIVFSGLKKKNNSTDFATQTDINANLIHYAQISIHGSFSSNPINLRHAMDLVNRKVINLKELVTATYSLDDLEKALHTVELFNGLKSVINKF